MEMRGSQAAAITDAPTTATHHFGVSDAVLPGLEAMLDTTHLLVSQKKDMLEMFSNYEMSNRYEIFNDQKKQVYYAVEDTLTGAICAQGGNRPFTIRLLDSKGREIMTATSKVNLCTREVNVELPPGKPFAIIKEQFAFLHPSFLVNDMSGRSVMKIVSPLQAALGSFQDVNFEILASDMKTKIGEISKQWRGFAEEMFSDADVFGLTMPDDLDANWKTVLLAATFLIDFTYYEDA